MKRLNAGFTLAEIIVSVSIIAILASILYANLNQGGAQSRDAKRQADLRALQSAIELYKNDNGRYPEGCNGALAWSGHAPTYACSGGGQYIVDLAPKYIKTLPVDPKLNGNDSGYVYTVNADGTVYKLMVKKTVETETVDYSHEFKSCDATNSIVNPGLCDATHPTNNKPNWCGEWNSQFQTSYAVWGGFVVPNISPDNANYDLLTERYTEDVICDIQ